VLRLGTSRARSVIAVARRWPGVDRPTGRAAAAKQ
jgi:hypothetical protein